MRIVLTNDDGIDSPGLHALKEVLQEEHEVWIVAPDGNRSGVSHSITLRNPVKVTKRSETEYACDGTPVDCIVLVHHDFIPVEPDLVISGINVGPNLGSDLIFSGTLAAARQACMFGYPGVAISVNTFTDPMYFGPAAEFIRKNVTLFKERWAKTHFLNINFPNLERIEGEVELTIPAPLTYSTEVKKFIAPDGGVYTFYHGDMVGASEAEGSDWGAVSRGNISVCPLNLYHVRLENAGYSPSMFAV